jgi:hypothetical protein
VSRPSVTNIVRREHHKDVLLSKPLYDLQIQAFRMTGKRIGDDYLLKEVPGFDMPLGPGEMRSEPEIPSDDTRVNGTHRPESVIPDSSDTAS